MTKNEKEIAEKQIVNNIMTGKQILCELSGEDINNNGGIKALIFQVKVNLVESLRAYGLDCWVTTISSVDENQVKDFDEFARKIRNTAVACY